MTRTFPRTCIECREKQVRPTVIDELVTTNHGGKKYILELKGIPVEKCGNCGAVTYGTDSDEAVNAAVAEKLSTPTPPAP